MKKTHWKKLLGEVFLAGEGIEPGSIAVPQS